MLFIIYMYIGIEIRVLFVINLSRVTTRSLVHIACNYTHICARKYHVLACYVQMHICINTRANSRFMQEFMQRHRHFASAIAWIQGFLVCTIHVV